MCKYNEGKVEEGTAELLLSTIAANNADDLERAMNRFAFAARTTNLKNRFSHLKISVSPEDKNISNYTFEKIGQRVLSELGYSNNPYAIFRHLDTEHPHIHIVLCRVGFDGKLVRDSFDGMKAKRIERALEKEFELTSSYERLLTKRGVRLPGYAERWQMKEEQAIRKDLTKKGFRGLELESRVSDLKKQSVNSMKRFVQNAVLECLYDHPNGEVFLRRLARRGISMVRHEFPGKGNARFGISYHYDPQGSRSSFKSKELPGQVAGDQIGNVGIGEEYFNHAYFNEVPVTAKVSNNGMAQLCLFDAAPMEPKKEISFRALNLGPAFMEKALRRTIHLSEDVLNTITFKRKNRKPEREYPQTASMLLKDEDPLISRAMIAAEVRSAERVAEVLPLLKSNQLKKRPAGLGTQGDLDFLMKQADRSQEKQLVPSIPLTDKPEKEALENPLVLEYLEKYGRNPSPLTRIALTYMEQGHWKELSNLLKTQMNIPEKLAVRADLVDDKILQLRPLGKEARSTAYEFEKWRYEIQAEYAYTADPVAEKVAHDTAALIAALKRGDQKEISRIITDLTPDLKRIPVELIGNVQDRAIVEELIRHTSLTIDLEESGKLKSTSKKDIGPADSEKDQENDMGLDSPKPKL